MSTPVIGHMDPMFVSDLGNTSELLRHVFGTKNRATFAVSGTGFSGMETALVNVIEPGDTVIVGVSGFFGVKAEELCRRLGAETIVVSNGFGLPVETIDIRSALEDSGDVKAVFLVSAETSVGLRQPLQDIAEVVHEFDSLLISDMVTLLGGAVVKVDEWEVDIAYSGSQKCIGTPPGSAPITFSPRAVEAIEQRKSPVPSWYLNALEISAYWAGELPYHHTCSSTVMYGLKKALELIKDEGLNNRAQRHEIHGAALRSGVEAMGLSVASLEGRRLGMLTPINIPEGIDDKDVRSALLEEYNTEIGGGLGDWAGKVWRIGLMGYGSTPANVLHILNALEHLLSERGHKCERGSATAAATQSLS
tara:strand:+ start:1364 stop:2452 length:1089 start_codon:yes stop_codon:yes gene_type:complete